MTKELNNGMDIIDSRDVIERIAELQAEVDDAREAFGEEWDNLSEAEREVDREDYDVNSGVVLTDGGPELAALLALQEEAEGYAPDWRHGAGLVRDSYWITYVQEMLRDIGDLPDKIPSYLEIDWEKTAQNIQIDYTSVDFDGQTYWVR